MITQDDPTITYPEILELFQSAQILCMFRNREVHAYIDNIPKNTRHTWRLQTERKYITRIEYTDYREKDQRWQTDLGSKNWTISPQRGRKLVEDWLDELPLAEPYSHVHLRIYRRDHRGWTLDHTSP